MTTAKHPQGAAYNGTGALKLSGDEPRRNFFRRMPKQEPEEKRTKAAPAAQKPPAAPAEERKGENLLMSFLGGWSIRGAFLAIAVIAAVIIGGTSMSGGRGSVIGSVLGMLILAVMNNLLNLIGVPPFLREAFKGIIVIGAVLLQKKEKAS